MVITIEDAPSIKHISIDINFDGSDTPEVELKTSGTPKIQKKSTANSDVDTFNDTLDLDENFDASTEIVDKPKIEEPNRDVKVSEDMINSEF